MSPARLQARMDSLLSFPVGLFHPLQHAVLSWRSPNCRPPPRTPKSTSASLTELHSHSDYRSKTNLKQRTCGERDSVSAEQANSREGHCRKSLINKSSRCGQNGASNL